MIVLVETNFVLELVFGRDKHACCRELLDLAEQGSIELVLPAYCLVEPYEAVIRRRRSRIKVHEQLAPELAEIARSRDFQQPAEQLSQLMGLLMEVGETELNALGLVTAELLEKASIVNLDAKVLRQANAYRGELSLSPQDAIVFSSVMQALELATQPGCFITKNRKDFSSPEILAALIPHSCKLLFDFEHGLNYVKGQIAGPVE